MQAITTKYVGPTDTRGARIQATCGDIRVTVPYAHELSGVAVHFEAVKALCAKRGLSGRTLTCGDISDGYVFVFTSENDQFRV